MSYAKCYHCGAEYGLHQSETENCPMGGVEETRDGKKQQWSASTFLEDKVRRLELAAPELLDALKYAHSILSEIQTQHEFDKNNLVVVAIKKAKSAIQRAEE